MLKFIYDTEAEIPATSKSLYSANADEKWELQVEGAVPKKQLDDFRAKGVEQLKAKDAELARFKDVDPDKYRDLLGKEKELEEGKIVKKDGVDALVEKRTGEMKVDYEKKLQVADTARIAAEDGLSAIRLDHALRDAGGKHGLRKEAVGDLLLRGRTSLKFVEGKLMAHDDAGQKMYGTNGEPMTTDEWVATLTKAAPHLFEESKGGGAAGGGGPIGHTGPNPWAPATRNLTQQMAITKADPKLAERLVAASKG